MNSNLPATQKQKHEWCPTNDQHILGKLPGDGKQKKIPTWFNQRRCFPHGHQTFQVPKMEVLTYISCMDTAYVRENPSPKWPAIRFRKPSNFRYLKLLVTTALDKFFHHAQGTEGRASPNPCFVPHASLGVLSIASMGLVIERSSPGNYEYHLCIVYTLEKTANMYMVRLPCSTPKHIFFIIKMAGRIRQNIWWVSIWVDCLKVNLTNVKLENFSHLRMVFA